MPSKHSLHMPRQHQVIYFSFICYQLFECVLLFYFIGGLFARHCPESKECQQGLLVLFLKLRSWRKKNPFSSCVRTFEGTFERSSLFWLQWRAVQWLQWNGKVNYIYIWKSCFCLTDLVRNPHMLFSIFLSSSASLHSHSVSTVSCHLNIGRWGEKIQRDIFVVCSVVL